MANLFKRAKEAVMNFFGMTNKKTTNVLKVATDKHKIINPDTSMKAVRGSRWQGWAGYTNEQIREMERNKWKTGGTTSCFKAARTRVA